MLLEYALLERTSSSVLTCALSLSLSLVFYLEHDRERTNHAPLQRQREGLPDA